MIGVFVTFIRMVYGNMIYMSVLTSLQGSYPYQQIKVRSQPVATIAKKHGGVQPVVPTKSGQPTSQVCSLNSTTVSGCRSVIASHSNQLGNQQPIKNQDCFFFFFFFFFSAVMYTRETSNNKRSCLVLVRDSE